MQHAALACCLLTIATAGCTSPVSQPTLSTSDETAVRKVLAEVFQVDAGKIEMERPLSEPPLNGMAIDLLDIVFRLEKIAGVELKKESLQRIAGTDLTTEPVKVTPRHLVLLLGDAKGSPKP